MKKESLEDFLKRGGKIQKVKPGAAAVLGSLDKSKIPHWDNDDVKLLKNAPIPQGSSLEFMAGNKVVLETADTITVSSDTNNSIDASLTIMEIT